MALTQNKTGFSKPQKQFNNMTLPFDHIVIPSYGPYKTLSFEKKLIQADAILACSPIVMLAVVFAHYILW